MKKLDTVFASRLLFKTTDSYIIVKVITLDFYYSNGFVHDKKNGRKSFDLDHVLKARNTSARGGKIAQRYFSIEITLVKFSD